MSKINEEACKWIAGMLEETFAYTNNSVQVVKYLIVDSYIARAQGYLNQYQVLDDDTVLQTIEGIDSILPSAFVEKKKQYPDLRIVGLTDTLRLRNSKRLAHPNTRLLELQD